MVSLSPLRFPEVLYPAFAPLSIPMANHLLLQEAKPYRHRPLQRPPDEQLIATLLKRIVRARTTVFAYLHPFVLADQKRQARGENRTFLTPDFLLEALTQYTPRGSRRYAEGTLDHWQKRGLLRREKIRGFLDLTSVAALLIARLSEEQLQKNWLPSCMEATEPQWWCSGQLSPTSPVQAIPAAPLPSDPPASLVLWTPWQGALWDGRWQMFGGMFLYRWAGDPGAKNLLPWEKDVSDQLQRYGEDPFLRRETIQAVLRHEAQQDILAHIAERNSHDGSVSVFYQPGAY